MSALRRCALAGLLLAVIAGALPSAFAATPLLHKRAPQFVRAGLNHQPVDLRAYRGKVVLLDFWATWCAPCQVEMPRFIAWQSKYGARGLQIIGISMDDSPAEALRVVRKLGLNYPVAMGDEKLGELYGGVLGLPLTFLIDTRGVVQAEFQGETDMNSIEQRFKPLLRPLSLTQRTVR
ncbi:MAG: TlpA disulfide reductase family protein [Terracidiphilus sp.]|nr:TlpA disulfide reductase family protein [Terracidiphilus sp.]